MAVACLANGYRFSKHQTVTRPFLIKLADKEDKGAEVRKAAHQTLQLSLLRASKLWHFPAEKGLHRRCAFY